MEFVIIVIWVSSKHKRHHNYHEYSKDKFVPITAPVEPTSIHFVLEVLVNVNISKIVKVNIIELVKSLLLVQLHEAFLLNIMRFNINIIIAHHAISIEKEFHDCGALFHFEKTGPVLRLLFAAELQLIFCGCIKGFFCQILQLIFTFLRLSFYFVQIYIHIIIFLWKINQI